jgi:hypothetical protein
MPAIPVSKTLQNVDDTLQLQLGLVGYGQPQDITAVVSLTGTFTLAVVAIEGVPIGQSLSSVPIPLAEINIGTGNPQGSPVGPFTSTGGPGSGNAFVISCGIYSLIQVRLVSIGGGAITCGIASATFPVTPGSNLPSPQMMLELVRIRIGINALLDGVSLQEISLTDLGL